MRGFHLGVFPLSNGENRIKNGVLGAKLWDIILSQFFPSRSRGALMWRKMPQKWAKKSETRDETRSGPNLHQNKNAVTFGPENIFQRPFHRLKPLIALSRSRPGGRSSSPTAPGCHPPPPWSSKCPPPGHFYVEKQNVFFKLFFKLLFFQPNVRMKMLKLCAAFI